MSIPIIPRVRSLGLYTAGWLHVGAFLVRMFGFVGGALFLFFSTQVLKDISRASTLSNVVVIPAALILPAGRNPLLAYLLPGLSR